jgi:hypothetical protein
MGSNAGVQIKSGTAHNIFVLPPKLTVKEITFIGDADIWYAEIPGRNTNFIVPDTDDVGKLFDPPEIRPLSGDPHWRRSAKNDMPRLSLPVVYIQEGTEIESSRDIRVSFEASDQFSGKIYIRATSISGINIAEQGVNFTNGKADNITFKMNDLPDTVSCYPGFSFEWEYRLSRSYNFRNANPTQHTFFIINDKPSNMNIPPHNKPIFEIFNWACNWASGYVNQEIVGAIWWHFSPIQRTHETGFIYAKNWTFEWRFKIKPEQDLMKAIQSRNDKDHRKRNAVGSRVFNSIFINCLAVNGIKSAEIKISLPQNPFRRDGVDYKCISWRPAIGIAQGSINPPKKLNEHWIANVVSDSGIWQIYDATYGFGPFNSQKPGSSGFINLEYESSIVYSFECERISDGEIIDLPYNPDPNIQPHLVSEITWQS